MLVIDNDENIRTGMSLLLRGWGCKCEAAASIEEALAMAERHRPDLVISDYHLGDGQSGIEAIAGLRRMLGENLPALLITGDTSADLLRDLELRQDIPLLHKPVSPRQLYRSILASLPR